MEGKNEQINIVTSLEENEKSDEKKNFWSINKEMLPYKIHFLLFVGGAGVVYPFQSAFGITVLGLTASNIAACYTTLQVAIFILKPGIGYIADYFNRLKAVIVGLAIIQVIFCFIIIIIPNTGMPGINKLQLADISMNETYCQLCFNEDALKHLILNRSLDEKSFRQIISCSNSNIIDKKFINCSSDYIRSTKSDYNSLEITQTSCNTSYTENLLLKKYRNLECLHDKENSSDILYIKNSQFSFLCILPIQIQFYHVKLSSHNLSRYCYALSDEFDLKLKRMLTKSDITPIHCSNLHKTFSLPKDEHSISIANFKTYQFWLFAICSVIAYTCVSSEFTMSDTACYESIKGSADYGQQRVWGAISWGLMAPFAGFINDYTEGYMTSWCIYAICTLLQIWNLSRMNLVKPDFSQNILKDIKTIFSSMEFLCFEVGVFLNGMFTGIIWYYLTWFVVSIGGNKLVIGLVSTIQCFFGEVPAMYFSGWLIKKLGHFNLISIALISHGIRFFLYSYLHNPWWILPIESLHGLTFGSFYAAMTSYGKLNSKPGTEATTQSVLCTTYEALGCGVGCLITGICLERYGGHTTFFYMSFMCVVATMINIFSTFAIKCRKSSQDVTKSQTSTERY